MIWTLDEAVGLVRGLQPLAKRTGFHVGIVGGVLNHGSSTHDLDLTITPLSGTAYDRDAFFRVCAIFGIEQIERVPKAYGGPPRDFWRGRDPHGRLIEFFVIRDSLFWRLANWIRRKWYWSPS